MMRACEWPRIALVGALSLAGGVASCGGTGAASNADAGETFIAYGSNFTDYPKWESTPLATAEHADDGGVPIDDAGCALGHDTSTNRFGFLNRRPAPGSTEFPVGTIFVKEMRKDGVAREGWQVFAMVKRGGGYNQSGAKGWEWFELAPVADGVAPRIVWRGSGPPAGEGYGSPACGGCNSCHGVAAGNDYVVSPEFDLKNF